MNIKLYFTYDPNRIRSEFYQGEVINAENEIATLSIFTCGHITGYLYNVFANELQKLNKLKKKEEIQSTKFKDSGFTDEIWSRDYSDKHLELIQDDMIEFNWFEYSIEFKNDQDTIYSTDIVGDINDCLEVLNSFIKQDYENL